MNEGNKSRISRMATAKRIVNDPDPTESDTEGHADTGRIIEPADETVEDTEGHRFSTK